MWLDWWDWLHAHHKKNNISFFPLLLLANSVGPERSHPARYWLRCGKPELETRQGCSHAGLLCGGERVPAQVHFLFSLSFTVVVKCTSLKTHFVRKKYLTSGSTHPWYNVAKLSFDLFSESSRRVTRLFNLKAACLEKDNIPFKKTNICFLNEVNLCVTCAFDVQFII